MLELIPGIRSTSSALSAERVRMEVTAQNIANAMSERGPDGVPFKRQKVLFETVLDRATSGRSQQKLISTRVENDSRPPRIVPDPSNPGKTISKPDINIHEEMIDYIAASRAYEANLAIARSTRNMTLQTLGIGKR